MELIIRTNLAWKKCRGILPRCHTGEGGWRNNFEEDMDSEEEAKDKKEVEDNEELVEDDEVKER